MERSMHWIRQVWSLGGPEVWVLRQILVISPDEQLCRGLRGQLEGAGFNVVCSLSLERSFLADPQGDLFLVLVDGEATAGEIWLAADFLSWFHRRCPVFLLANEPIAELEQQCDRRFPRRIAPRELLAKIRELG